MWSIHVENLTNLTTAPRAVSTYIKETTTQSEIKGVTTKNELNYSGFEYKRTMETGSDSRVDVETGQESYYTGSPGLWGVRRETVEV